MLIDTHAHVNFVAYKNDGDEVTKRALKENIWMINVGSERDTSRRAVEYAKKYSEGVFAAVGLHPIHLQAQEINAPVDEFEKVEFETQAQTFDYEYYKNLAKDSKVVAIGEVGLDYFHINSKLEIRNPRLTGRRAKQIQNSQTESQKNLQKETLLRQLELAIELDKAVIFHCREAHNDLLEILKNFNPPTPLLKGGERGLAISKKGEGGLGPFSNEGGGGLRGVIHSFSGRWSQAQQYLEMGFYLGFNGIITFARDYDRVLKQMPLERLVLETDCPYLTPIPFRGKRNEPAYVKFVAEKVAEVRGISADEVMKATTKNARELFKI